MAVMGAYRPVLSVCNAVAMSPELTAWTAVVKTVGMAPSAAPNITGMEVGPLNSPATVLLKYAKTPPAAVVTKGVAWLRNSVPTALRKSAGTRPVMSGIAPPRPRVCSSERMSVNGIVMPANATSAATDTGIATGLGALMASTGAMAIAPAPTTAAIPAVRYERTETCMR